MTVLQNAMRGLLDGVDAVFDALAAILRVLAWGAFQPDARSYRLGGFLELAPKQFLVQDIRLPAEDAREARTMVALEPERYLPLDPALCAYDVAGPIADDDEEAGSAAPARYLVGVARVSELESLRGASGKRGLIPIEGFVARPPSFPGQVLLFRDEKGDSWRRTRRALSLVVALTLAWSVAEAWSAWQGYVEAKTAEVEGKNLASERRVRLANRRLLVARGAIAQGQGAPTIALTDAAARLTGIAGRLPSDADVQEVSITPDKISIKGRAYNVAMAELELRRLFENAKVDFSAQPGAPGNFQMTADTARPGLDSTALTPPARPAAAPGGPR